jgi:hypothetical protein
MQFTFMLTKAMHTTSAQDDAVHYLRRDAEASGCSSLRIWHGYGDAPVGPLEEPRWHAEVRVPDGPDGDWVQLFDSKDLDALIDTVGREVDSLVR